MGFKPVQGGNGDMPIPHALSPELLSVLVCPHDHGELDYSLEKSSLTCRSCGKTFPVVDGIPNMLK